VQALHESKHRRSQSVAGVQASLLSKRHRIPSITPVARSVAAVQASPQSKRPHPSPSVLAPVKVSSPQLKRPHPSPSVAPVQVSPQSKRCPSPSVTPVQALHESKRRTSPSVARVQALPQSKSVARVQASHESKLCYRPSVAPVQASPNSSFGQALFSLILLDPLEITRHLDCRDCHLLGGGTVSQIPSVKNKDISFWLDN